MQADEAKVAALESIFGGQDITASVIRTVLSSKDNKFDEAVDSLLNMSNNNEKSKLAPAPSKEPEDDASPDKRQKEKLQTLGNMFGDLSQSVICTVLESNEGELVDAVDTLLNLTSKEINPNYLDVNQREIERARQEEELKNYEDFKKLQLALQEEEARQIREQQQKIEQDTRKRAEAVAAEERKRKEALLEQERLLKEYESQKQIQADIVAKERAIKTAEAERKANEGRKQTAEQQRERERELEEAQEKLRKAWEEKLKLLSAEEEKVRQLQAKQQAEEEARKLELIAREQACAAQEERIRKERAAEEARLAERKAHLEAVEAAKVEELARMRREATQREDARRKAELQQREELEQQLRIEAETKAHKQKLEEEERARQRRSEEERLSQERRLKFQEEKLEIQRERAKLEALRLAQEERFKQEEQEKLRKEAERARWEAERKLVLEQEERQRKLEEQQRRAEEERLRMAEEELVRRTETERIRREEEERQGLFKIEQERLRLEEEKRLLEEEQRDQALKEEAEKQQAAYEEERRKKSAIDMIAASAVFLPPKAEAAADQIALTASASGDTVTASWDLPEGNATATNWLGLYPVRALPNTNKYVQFVYTNGAHSGQHVFRGVTPGHYEVRFFATRLYQHTACTHTVRVGPTPTLGAQLQGDHLLVYYTLDPMSTTPSREWLGIYEKTQRRNKKYLSSAYGNAEGQVMMKAPRTPGVYEVRLFATGAVYNEQAKCEFTVEDNDCVLIDPAAVAAGANATVCVSWVMRTVEPSTSDWIGLYKASEANNNRYLSCTYTQGASVGSVTIAVPKEAGVYELRLFAKAKGKYTTFRTSPPLTIV